MTICRSFRGIKLLHFPGLPAIDTFYWDFFLSNFSRGARKRLATVLGYFTTRSEATAGETEISSNFFLRGGVCAQEVNTFLSPLCSRIEVTRHGNVAPEIFLRNVCMQTDSNRIWMAVAKRFATQSRDEFVTRERESGNNPAMSQNLKNFSSTRINVYFNST